MIIDYIVHRWLFNDINKVDFMIIKWEKKKEEKNLPFQKK